MGIRVLPYLSSFITAALIVVGVGTFDYLANERFRAQTRTEVLNQLSAVRARLEGGLNSRLFLTQALVTRVSNRPYISWTEFMALAKRLTAHKSGIRSIQLARNTIITHIYPLKGNEAALGLKLLEVPGQRDAVQRALDTRMTVVVGPVKLVQGGEALISRTPIYKTPRGGAPGSGAYWGLASILIDPNALLKEAGLLDAKTKLQFALRGKDSLGASGALFFGGDATFRADPVLLDVALPNGSWQLAAVPKGGWPSVAPDAWWWRIGGGLLALLAGAMVWFLAFDPIRLRESVLLATTALRNAQGQLETKVRERTVELLAANKALRESEARLAEAQRIARLGNWAWNIPSNELYWSDEVYRIFGLEPQAFGVTYEAFLASVHPDEREVVKNAISDALYHKKRYSIDHRIVLPSGKQRIVHEQAVTKFDEEGNPIRMVGTVQDITERAVTEAQLEYMAYHDALTDLPNRTLMRDRLGHAMAKAHRTGRTVALLFLDLDRFKTVNDSLGHDAGDRMLETVAKRLRHCIREDDTLARLGGDEFTVVLEDVEDNNQVAAAAQKILDVFTVPFDIYNHEMFVTASVGISLYPENGVDEETLMKNADTAMYRAKELGRNSYQFFSSDMGVQAFERMAVETQLRRAVERKELELYYQPLINVGTGKIAALEVLARWEHEDLGQVPSDRFIPIAEETGLIVPLGHLVLHTACLQHKAWQEAGLPPVQMMVNLSARQFGEKGLTDHIARLFEETHLDPKYLCLEITESTLLKDQDIVYAALKRLKAMNVRVAIDDFGTGHSSLGYLRRFSIDILKIDSSFIHDLTVNADDAAIVEAIIAMGHKLKLSVVAEGVETEEQALLLRNYGCDLVQGFLFSKPLPAGEVAGLFGKEIIEFPDSQKSTPAVA